MNEWINEMGSRPVPLSSLSYNHTGLSSAPFTSWAHFHLPVFFFQFLLLESSIHTSSHGGPQLVTQVPTQVSLSQTRLPWSLYPTWLFLPSELLCIMLLWFCFFITFISEIVHFAYFELFFVYMVNFWLSVLKECSLRPHPYLPYLSWQPPN